MPKPKKPNAPPDPFRWFDSSPEVIRLVVMMYVRYPLSLRNVEDLLFERGIDICHETVRLWWTRFGPMFAGEIRRRRVHHMRQFTHWRWHLDEMYVRINGEMRYLWRAIDHEGEVLEWGCQTKRVWPRFSPLVRPKRGCWARRSRLPLCLHGRAMPAARNEGQRRGEARPARFGLTTPFGRLVKTRRQASATPPKTGFGSTPHWTAARYADSRSRPSTDP
jgi:hypothetical protein